MYGIGYEKSAVKTKRAGPGFKALITDKQFHRFQENFEHNLGRYAYRNPKAIQAVDKGLLKMREVLYKYYSDKFSEIEDEAKREQEICLKSFTNDTDPSSEGQIGNVSYAQLCEVIGDGLKGKNAIINKVIDENAKQNGGKFKGNLREKYTAFYNAAYYKGVYDKGSKPNDKIVNFKNIMQEIAVNRRSELVDQLGLDKSALETQKFTSAKPSEAGLIRSVYNSGILNKIMKFKARMAKKRIKKYQNKRDRYRGPESSWKARYYDKQIKKYSNKRFNAKNFNKRFHAKDVYDLTLISLEPNKLEVALDYLKNGKSFRFRSEEEAEELKRNLSYYNDIGLNFSDRESEFLLKTLSDEYIEKNGENDKSIDEQRRELMLEAYNACMKHQLYKSFDPNPSLSLLTEEERKIVEERVAKTRSPLKEGFIGKEVKDNDKFLRKRMQDKNGVRIVNGFSGTTSRMLKTYKWLGLGSDFMNFRLGLMGWMLPNDDHSLWEIIIGSHNVGVKGKEDLADIVSLDQTVDPLNESEIRKNVCEEYSDKGKMFPHEIVYYKQMVESNSDISMGIIEDFTSSRSGEMLRSRNEIAASNELKNQSEKLKREIEDIKQKLTLINEDKKKLFTNEEIQKIMTCLDNLKNFSQTFRNTSDELSIPAKPTDFLTEIERNWGIAVKNESVDEIINAANFMVNKFSSLKDEERTKGAYDQICNITKLVIEKLSSKKEEMLVSIASTEEQKREPNKLDDIALSLENNKKSKESQIDDIEKELAKEKNMYTAQKAAILSYTADFSGLLTNVSKLDNTRNPIKRAYIHILIKKELINQGISFDGKTRKDKRIKKSEFVKKLSAQNHIIGEAIKKADKKYKGFPLYSGQWTINLNEKGMIGKTITWDKPTSASKSPDVARKFSKRPVAGFTNFALFEIKATGKNGLDLTQGANDVGKVDKHPMNLSVFGFSEQEVLFAPGTKLKITDVIKNVDITNYKRTINKTKPNDENPDEIEYYRWKEQKIKNEKGNEETIQVIVGKKVGTLIRCEEV